MTVQFGWETLAKLRKEPNFTDLLTEHWKELGVHKEAMPLDPDFAYMERANETNFFMVWAARKDRRLIGYIAFWIKEHLHYKTVVTGVEDLYMLTAGERKGTVGYRLFSSVKEALKARGVKRIFLHEKWHYQQARHRENCVREARRRLLIPDEVSDETILAMLETYADGALGKLFKRLGMTHTDNLWSQML